MEKEPTIGDVLKEVRAQESRTESRFEEVLEAVNKGFSGVQTQIEGLKTDVADIKADVQDTRRQLNRTDGKVNALVNILERKTVIAPDDKSAILV